jgi:transposase
MLLTTENSSYIAKSPDIADLKALIRHRSRLKSMRTRLRLSVSRLVNILFPELCGSVWSIHQASSYAMFLEFPTASSIADCHLTRLGNLLGAASRGKYGKDKALEIKNLASKSVGTNSRVIGFELQQTIRLITNVSDELDVLDSEIKALMQRINSPILTIPGISYNLGSVILSEIGNIENFATPSKLLAFAGLDPSTYQSGNYNAASTRMVKRGSGYLRWAIIQAAKYVSRFDPTFAAYAEKKRAEGKHYFVVLSHVGRKLIRVIFHMLKNNQAFVSVA